jgi:hypothetical protein
MKIARISGLSLARTTAADWIDIITPLRCRIEALKRGTKNDFLQKIPASGVLS